MTMVEFGTNIQAESLFARMCSRFLEIGHEIRMEPMCCIQSSGTDLLLWDAVM